MLYILLNDIFSNKHNIYNKNKIWFWFLTTSNKLYGYGIQIKCINYKKYIKLTKICLL